MNSAVAAPAVPPEKEDAVASDVIMAPAGPPPSSAQPPLHHRPQRPGEEPMPPQAPPPVVPTPPQPSTTEDGVEPVRLQCQWLIPTPGMPPSGALTLEGNPAPTGVPCMQTFYSAEDLFEHVSAMHVGRKSLGNLCLTCRWPNCGHSTEKRDHIISHIRVHIPSYRPFKCQVCRRGFSRAPDLRKHLKIHENFAAQRKEVLERQDSILVAVNDESPPMTGAAGGMVGKKSKKASRSGRNSVSPVGFPYMNGRVSPMHMFPPGMYPPPQPPPSIGGPESMKRLREYPSPPYMQHLPPGVAPPRPVYGMTPYPPYAYQPPPPHPLAHPYPPFPYYGQQRPSPPHMQQQTVQAEQQQQQQQDDPMNSTNPSPTTPMENQLPSKQPLQRETSTGEDLLHDFIGNIKRRKLVPQYSQEMANTLSAIADQVLVGQPPSSADGTAMVSGNEKAVSAAAAGPEKGLEAPTNQTRPASITPPNGAMPYPGQYPMRYSPPMMHPHYAHPYYAQRLPYAAPFPASQGGQQQQASGAEQRKSASHASGLDMLIGTGMVRSPSEIMHLNQFFSQLYADMETNKGAANNNTSSAMSGAHYYPYSPQMGYPMSHYPHMPPPQHMLVPSRPASAGADPAVPKAPSPTVDTPMTDAILTAPISAAAAPVEIRPAIQPIVSLPRTASPMQIIKTGSGSAEQKAAAALVNDAEFQQTVATVESSRKKLDVFRSLSDASMGVDVDRYLDCSSDHSTTTPPTSAAAAVQAAPVPVKRSESPRIVRSKLDIFLKAMQALSLRSKSKPHARSATSSPTPLEEPMSGVENSGCSSSVNIRRGAAGRYPVQAISGSHTNAADPTVSPVQRARAQQMLSEPSSLVRRVVRTDSFAAASPAPSMAPPSVTPSAGALQKMPLQRTDGMQDLSGVRYLAPLKEEEEETMVSPTASPASTESSSSERSARPLDRRADIDLLAGRMGPPLALRRTTSTLPTTGTNSAMPSTGMADKPTTQNLRHQPVRRCVSQPVPQRASVSEETRRKHIILIRTFLQQLELVWKDVAAVEEEEAEEQQQETGHRGAALVMSPPRASA